MSSRLSMAVLALLMVAMVSAEFCNNLQNPTDYKCPQEDCQNCQLQCANDQGGWVRYCGSSAGVQLESCICGTNSASSVGFLSVTLVVFLLSGMVAGRWIAE